MRLSKTILEIAVAVLFGLGASPGLFSAGPPTWPPGEVQATSPEQLLAQGFDAERRGNFEAAERFYQNILQTIKAENDRSRIPPLHRLAVLKARQKQFDESEHLFQQAVRLDGNNLALLGDYAQLQFDRKQYRDAEIILKYAFLLEPNNTRTLYNLGYAVALQPDRQTEGLRYLRLALGEPRAFRELASICRILGENEQAQFAEQRAAQLEQRLQAGGQTPEPPSFEARKELYDQIKKELIRAKSVELAHEFERAGIQHIEMLDAEEQKKNAASPLPPPTSLEPLVGTEVPIKIAPSATQDADSFLTRIEPTTPVPPEPVSETPSDPWAMINPSGNTVSDSPPEMLTTSSAVDLKPLPVPEPLHELDDRRPRISNGQSAIPLPSVIDQGSGGDRVLRTPPTLADTAVASQYPRYFEISPKPTIVTPSQRPENRAVASVEEKVNIAETPKSVLPATFDLVQPVNLVAISTRREQGASAPTAPTPEKIDEIAAWPMVAIVPVMEAANEKGIPPTNIARHRSQETPLRSNAPMPENIASWTPTPAAAPSMERQSDKGKESGAIPKGWKEIHVEPYVYVENVRPQKSKETQSDNESKPLFALDDPWKTPLPSSDPVAVFREDHFSENTESKATNVQKPTTTVKSTQEPQPKQAIPPIPPPAVEPSIIARTPPTADPETTREHRQETVDTVKPVPAPAPQPRPAQMQEFAKSGPPILVAPIQNPPEPKPVEHRQIPEPSPIPEVTKKQPEQHGPVHPVLSEVVLVPPQPTRSAPSPPQSISSQPRPPLPTPPQPQLSPQEDDVIGIAKTPKVNNVNVFDLEPSSDNQPGFARSGKAK